MPYYLINGKNVIKLSSPKPIRQNDFSGIINCDIYDVEEYLVVSEKQDIRDDMTFGDYYVSISSDILELHDNDSAMLLFLLEYRDEREEKEKILDEHIFNL